MLHPSLILVGFAIACLSGIVYSFVMAVKNAKKATR